MPNNRGGIDLIDVFATTVGYEIRWTEKLTSTAVYSLGRLNNTPLQEGDALRSAEYIAVNLIWNPINRVYAGIEFLHGKRVDKNRDSGEANRIQMSVRYDLP